MRFSFICFLIAFTISSCQKEDVSVGSMNNIVGHWINPTYTDSSITFERSDWTNIDAYRLSIFENSKVVERKNAGWCGTPPITYADFEGTWSLNDSLLTINVGYWGGEAEYQWKVVSVDMIRLKVVVVKQTFNYIYYK